MLFLSQITMHKNYTLGEFSFCPSSLFFLHFGLPSAVSIYLKRKSSFVVVLAFPFSFDFEILDSMVNLLFGNILKIYLFLKIIFIISIKKKLNKTNQI